MSLHHVSLNNSKNTKHTHISLTGTDHCNSNLSKNIQFEKTNLPVFLIFHNDHFFKGRILDELRVSFKTWNQNACLSKLSVCPCLFITKVAPIDEDYLHVVLGFKTKSLQLLEDP